MLHIFSNRKYKGGLSRSKEPLFSEIPLLFLEIIMCTENMVSDKLQI
jgi:hypothetical protein